MTEAELAIILQQSHVKLASPLQVESIFQRHLEAKGGKEAEFMAEVMQYAKMLGWQCYHTYNSQRSEAGFPDLLMLRPPECIVAELKAPGGKISKDQQVWLALFASIPGIEVYLWYPSDLRAICERLTKHSPSGIVGLKQYDDVPF